MTPDELIKQAKAEAQLLQVGMSVYLRRIPEGTPGMIPSVGPNFPYYETPLKIVKLTISSAFVRRADGEPFLYSSGEASYWIRVPKYELTLQPLDSSS
jgi:hypothetical protein